MFKRFAFGAQRPSTMTSTLKLPLITLISWFVLLLSPSVHASLCVAGDVGGSIWRDTNANGVQDTHESVYRAEQILITAYDTSNAVVGTDTVDANGDYAIAGAGASVPIRLEFANLPSYLEFGAAGANSATHVQFATVAGCDADVAVNYPNEYCDDDPDLITSCYVNGDPTAGGSAGSLDGIVSFKSSARGAGGTIDKDVLVSDVGSIWGLAYNRETQNTFASTLVKRHAGFGPIGIGGIYAIDYSGATSSTDIPTVAPFVDLVALGLNLGPIGTTARGLPSDLLIPNRDTDAFTAVGREGLGDLDISDDNTTLYATDLFNREVVAIDISAYNADGTTLPSAIDVSTFALPSTATVGCTNGEARPFALKYWQGKLYAGLMCSGESGGTAANLTAHVYAYDFSSTAWTDMLAAPISMNYSRLGWRPAADFSQWTDNPADIAAHFPQPILADIEFDVDGAMILGFIDRAGLQMGSRNSRPDSDVLTATFFNNGEILHTSFNTVSGKYELENSAASGGQDGCWNGASIDNDVPFTGFFGEQAAGPGGGNYFCDDSIEEEQTLGALAVIPSIGVLAATSYDSFSIETGGVFYYDHAEPGVLRSTNALQVYAAMPGLMGKATGLGDLEALCKPAPIEIGNRVWLDDNNDGIQGPDATEVPIIGVEVQLIRTVGVTETIVGTTTTDANGNYLFNNTNVTLGGASGIVPGTGTSGGASEYTVRIINAEGGSQQTPLAGLSLTSANAGASDASDSDGTLSGSAAEYVVPYDDIMLSGHNSHSYDFGFRAGVTPPTGVTVGNQVWLDANNDSQIDAAEGGLAGVTVELFLDANGDGALTTVAEQTPINTMTTGTDGFYLFSTDSGGTALAPGDYIIGIPATNFAGALTGHRSSGTTLRGGTYTDATSVTTDANADNDEDGQTQTSGFYAGGVLSSLVNVTATSEPTSETSANAQGATPAGETPGMTDPNDDGDSNVTVDFGFFTPVSVGSTVFIDDNDDGQQAGTSEVGIPSVGLQLFQAGDDPTTATAVASASTTGTGDYLFADLPPGDYFIYIPVPPTSAPESSTTTDANDNGVDGNDNGTQASSGDPVISPTINLAAGAEPVNANETFQGGGQDDSADTSGDMTVDFGFIPALVPSVSIGSTLFYDINDDGLHATDGSELGIDGVTVELYRSTDTPGTSTPLNSTTTAGGGHYLFSADTGGTPLAPGDYLVYIPVPPASAPLSSTTTDTNDNSEDGDDNGAQSASGQPVTSPTITLTVGAEPTGAAENETGTGGAQDDSADADGDMTVDFGFVPPVSIGSTVFFDINDDGLHATDGSEIGIVGVTVELFNSSDDPITATPVNSVVTDGNGLYFLIQIPLAILCYRAITLSISRRHPPKRRYRQRSRIQRTIIKTVMTMAHKSVVVHPCRHL